jgi:hypothetical protein
METLGAVLRQFLDRYPFSSTRLTSRHFHIFSSTLKEIMRQELEPKKFSKR